MSICQNYKNSLSSSIPFLNAWIKCVVLLWSAKQSKVYKKSTKLISTFPRNQNTNVSVRRVKENQTHRGRPPGGRRTAASRVTRCFWYYNLWYDFFIKKCQKYRWIFFVQNTIIYGTFVIILVKKKPKFQIKKYEQNEKIVSKSFIFCI